MENQTVITIRDFLDAQIEKHTRAVEQTENANQLMADALTAMYRRHQLLGALTALTQLRDALVDEAVTPITTDMTGDGDV